MLLRFNRLHFSSW